MAPSNGRLAEGVFAIHKPPAISSAQVIRDVQTHFNPSNLFRPWLQHEQAKKDAESHNQKNKRRSWKQRQPAQVKIGHGGTLDPMATGVLILGVGSGTKSLNQFLECTKSYECVLLFGAATDTYDTEGKVVARKPFEHITREKVEEALGRFRGGIMQKPPIFSALRVQGKRMYEYAREGKELPVEIKERPVTVEELEVVEWCEGGSHQWQWPEREAEGLEREVVGKAMNIEEKVGEEGGVKRKREEENMDGTVGGAVEPAGPPEPKRVKEEDEPVVSGALPATDVKSGQPAEETAEQQATTTEPSKDTTASSDEPVASTEQNQPATQEPAPRQPCPAPAVRLRMTVTSGFYVRSLCHDLAMALDSVGCMASLVRTRQGQFSFDAGNVLSYEDLAEGEEKWGPKVKEMLEAWGKKNDVVENGAKREGKEKEEGRSRRMDAKPPSEERQRRNTSSPEAE